MCALIYQYIRPSQKITNMYGNNSTKYFTIAKKNHYSNLDIDTIDHEKTIDCTTHHVCQEIRVEMMMDRCLPKG
jgi:hypothetical protein